METSHWVTIGLFFLGQVVSMVGVVYSTKIDVSKLKGKIEELATDMLSMQLEIKQLGTVLITLADFKGEMKLLQERLAMQGKRLDDTIAANNAKELRYEALLDKLRSDVESRKF